MNSEQYRNEIIKMLEKAYDDYFEGDDGHCKPSEGHITITRNYGNYWERKDKIDSYSAPWSIMIYSYVFGPVRQHYFEARTEQKAWGKAHRAVSKWLESSHNQPYVNISEEVKK